MIYITAVHMVGGIRHEHIAEVSWWDSRDGRTDKSTRAVMVDYIDNKNGDVRVQDGEGWVQVVTVNATPKYLRTIADGRPTDNLLALPRY